ncbi:MAG: DUF1501 domain-containing protein [Opitutaceae bacterium]|nr:DUF1501 domain-containing protein [Opitutaceae bacterium]
MKPHAHGPALAPAQFGPRLLDRRDFLRTAGGLAGSVALLRLLAGDNLLASTAGSVRPQIDSDQPYALRAPHFEPKAKQVLVIFCVGAVSHVDTFDYKPDLFKYDGQKPPGIPAVTFEGPTGNIAKPRWEFKPRGQSGKMVSELLPNVAALADDMCFIHSLTSSTSAHPQGENFLNTGFTLEGFPSLGAWVTYALGTANQQLPAFVAINDPRGKPRSGKNNWGSGFLPAAYQGTDFSAARPLANLGRPARISAEADRRAKHLLEAFNAEHARKFPGDTDLAGRIASYELAGRMQMSIPDVTDLKSEPAHVHQLYGTDTGTDLKKDYAKNCILARRLLEQGVRVVQLFNGSDAQANGISNWDSHANIESTHAMQAEIFDQPTAALLADMKQRGMLKDTLVVRCTEFGRMPFLQANGTGRDHNPDSFTCWLMGAGVKAGTSFGASDNFGFKAAQDASTLYDFNATILHLLGLDHERLTYYNNGIERRLTNVHGHVLKQMIA